MAGHVEDFATQLTELKERSGRSYGALAGRLHVSTSTLHRYCNGAAVPAEYAPVERFARLCGATPAELVALHRRWLLADAERRDGGTAAAIAALAAVAEDPVATPLDVPSEIPGGVPGEIPGASEADAAQSAQVAHDASKTAAPNPTPDTVEEIRSASGDDDGTPRRPRRKLLLPGAVAAVAAVAVVVPLTIDDHTGTKTAAASGPSPTTTASATVAAPGDTPATTGASSTPATSSPSPTPTPTVDNRPVPLTAAVVADNWGTECGQWFYAAKPTKDVPPPPGLPDLPLWVGPIGAVPGQHLRLQVTVQGLPGRTDEPQVVLGGMEVQVVSSKPAPKGYGYTTGSGCGGGLVPASFAIDLDQVKPSARPVPGMEGANPTPVLKFPLGASSSDSQILDIDARTQGKDVTWYLRLRWTCGDRTGWLKIDDHGRPFETIGLLDDPLYFYDGHKWAPTTDSDAF